MSTVHHQEYLNTVYTAIGICHVSSVGCLLMWSIWTMLEDANRTSMTNTYCCVYSVEITLMMDSGLAGRPDHEQQHCYHHAPTVKPGAVTAVVELLMMGVRKIKTRFVFSNFFFEKSFRL